MAGNRSEVAAGVSGNTISLGNGADTVSATGGDNVVSVGNGRDSISVEGHGQEQLGLSQAAQLPSRQIESDISCLKARLRSRADSDQAASCPQMTILDVRAGQAPSGIPSIQCVRISL